MQNDTRQDSNAKNSRNSGEWGKVCNLFKKHYGVHVFDHYIKACVFEKITNNTAIINAPIRLIKEYIETEYREKLQALWQQINADVQKIRVTIGASTRNLDSDKPQTAQIIKLPIWPEATRGVPNSAFRGSLFAAIQGKQRQAFKKTLICDEDNLKIYFTGWQFDQSDLDVWEALLHMAKNKPLGEALEFTENSFLKMLGRSNGKANYEWLRETIDRLNSGLVQITHNNYSYMGNLLTEAERDEITQHAKIIINPKMKRLFDAGYTITNWEERQRIGTRKPLALWLHGFIGSHAKLYPTKVETFHRLSGSANAEMRSFKRQLIKALDHLKNLDLIKDFWFENNLVHIEKYPSKSQIKYLSKVKK